MHFQKCSLKAFGHFRDVRFDDLSDEVVVLLGPNEAGKSTFFEFLQTMLYGVYPTNPEKHRYTPRDGQALEGSADIILSDGSEISVSRRLARVPQGHLTNGLDVDLRNKPVPAADFVSSRVFDAIYALDLHDMTGLEGRAWADVQDRLLGGMNLDFLRSARSVIEEIEREANELWRPDRRGRPLARRIREERDEVSTRLASARQREAELIELQNEITEAENRLNELRAELPVLQAEARRLDRIGPIAVRWRKVEAFRTEAGNVQSYKHVPENPGAILAEWHRRDDDYATQLDAIERQIEQSEMDQVAVSEADQTVVRYGAEIHGWSKRSGAHETNLAGLRDVGIELCELRMELGTASRKVAVENGDKELVRSIGTTNLDELGTAIANLTESSKDVSELLARDADLDKAIARRKPFIPVAVIAAGAVAAAAGVVQSIAIVWMSGASVGLFGVVWLAFELAKTSSLRSERDRLQLQKRIAEHDLLAEQVDDQLALLEVHPTLRERPEISLVSALGEVKELLERRSRLVTRARAFTGMLDADRSAVRDLAAACAIRTDLDVAATVELMQKHLDEAAERVRRAESAQQRLFRLNRDRERILADKQALVDQIVQVEAALEELGGGDIRKGVDVLERRRAAKTRADHEETTLDKDHSGWRDLIDELEALTDEDMGRFTDLARQERENRLEELRRDERFEFGRVARKQNQLKLQLKNETPDEVESRIELIDEQLQRVRRKRDRLVLLANIMKRADQQFRFKHQPDVIRKASEYLQKITGGRYPKLLLEDDGRTLKVFERGSGFPMEVDESLSQGTRDQVYLSIRFALMDHLDANHERLPAFLDEVFVNWDEDRRLLGYEILKDLAQRRQVFVFTCHPWMADELRNVVKAKLIQI